MTYEVALVNPKTGAQATMTVFADKGQAEASPCLQTYVQQIARPEIPAGFMPIGNGVKPATLQ